VAVWGIYLVWKGQIDLGGFTFLMGTVGIARDSMAQFFGSVARQYENALFADDFLEMMRLEPMIKNPATGIKIDSIQRIEFEHVSFAYPGGRGEVLHDISFELSCGDKVALVGLNGSGKTTLIKLLCRFYDPTSGRVLVNGIDLRELELESYYARMSALFQEYLNYRSFNVSEAIEFGRSDRELDVPKRDQAASDSESADFIREFANGYDQILGKWFTGGEGLSVGQWQKLALARAFYRGSDLLILDEPTASVDAQSEMKIFDKIASMGAQQTALFISHRFSTVLQANRIMMLEEGRITENGSHAELLANNRSYARLYRMQAKAFETTPPFN
jgi:ATP-binding cassette subfamily B protein